MKGVINALKYVLSFSQESTKERPGTSRMVPGLSRRLKGHILTFFYPDITDIAPLESLRVQKVQRT